MDPISPPRVPGSSKTQYFMNTAFWVLLWIGLPIIGVFRHCPKPPELDLFSQIATIVETPNQSCFAAMRICAESKAQREARAERRNAKQVLSLTPRQREISVGVMVGDASLQAQRNGNFRLKFQMTARNASYANLLRQEFGEVWIPSEPHEIIRPNSNMLGFQTIGHQELVTLADLFLDKVPSTSLGSKPTYRKIVRPNLITNHLTARGLAFWFMDDGGKADYTSNQGKGIVLNTQGFDKESVKMMCDELNNKFNLKCWVKPNKGKHVICISGKSFEDFEKLVDPFLIDSMRSKMPTPRKVRGASSSGSNERKVLSRVDDIV